jgi:AcrR family transcriptional regulator
MHRYLCTERYNYNDRYNNPSSQEVIGMSSERGRPRAFDEDEVLERAVQVFWRHGFQAASMSELTAAMGLNKPSLYAAFGDKEQLYLRALQRYVERWIAERAEPLESAPDGRAAIEGFLRAMAAMFTDAALPGGCFIVNGTADADSQAPAAIQDALRRALEAAEDRMKRRIERSLAGGELAAEVSPAALAGLYASVLNGLAVMAKSGATRAKLNGVIATAMTAWPQSPSPHGMLAAGARSRRPAHLKR